MTDRERLLGPVSADSSCGPRLDSERVVDESWRVVVTERVPALAAAAAGGALRPERLDLGPAIEAAEALFGRTKDLRVAAAYAALLTAARGVDGLADGLELVVALLERYWDDVHPTYDPVDRDFVARLNALAALGETGGMLRILRASRLALVPDFGVLTCRQAERALGIVPPSEGEQPSPPESVGQLELMLAASIRKGGCGAVRRALDGVSRIQSLLAERIEADRAAGRRVADSASVAELAALATRLAPLAEVVGRVAARIAEEAPVPIPPAPPAPPTRPPGGAREPGGSHPPRPDSVIALPPPDAISSREDVRRLLEAACDYLERTEPSHPAPLLVRRAVRLLSMNFVDLMRELAPDSIESIRTIAGTAAIDARADDEPSGDADADEDRS